MHGGVAEGGENLSRHVENLKKFGLPVIVAINKFSADTEDEVNQVRQICAELGVDAIESDHWGNGGAGAEYLAQAVASIIEKKRP